MQLYSFLAVVVSLSCGSLPPGEIDPWRACTATFGMTMGWILLAHVGARMIAIQVKSDHIDPVVAADWLEKQLEAFRWLGLGVAVLCLAGFGLAGSLDSIPLLNDSMSLQAIVLLAPVVLMTMGTWSAEHRYGVLLGYTEPGLSNHLGTLWSILRGNLTWLVVPVLLLLAVGDLLTALPISSQSVTVVGAVLVVLFIPLGLPWIIRHLFKTDPLDQPTAQWIDSLLAAAGLNRTRVIRWNTQGRTFNAMVAGFFPSFRTLVISDRLLDQLPRPQIAMVVLHEAAHLRRRHVPIRMLAVIPAWIAGTTVSRIGGEAAWAMPVGTAVGIVLTMLLLRWVAYRTEFDADVNACLMASRLHDHLVDLPRDYDTAADTLALALYRVTHDQPSARKPTWLHPGVADRVAWMRRMRREPTASNNTAGTITNPA